MLEKTIRALRQSGANFFLKRVADESLDESFASLSDRFKLRSVFLVYPDDFLGDLSLMYEFEDDIRKVIEQEVSDRFNFASTRIDSDFWWFGFGFIPEPYLSLGERKVEYVHDVIFYPDIAMARNVFLSKEKYELDRSCISLSDLDVYRNPQNYQKITRK